MRDQRLECHVFSPDTQIRIRGCYDGVGVTVAFGKWPQRTHTIWYLDDEGELDNMINNLLAAEMEYKQKKGELHHRGKQKTSLADGSIVWEVKS